METKPVSVRTIFNSEDFLVTSDFEIDGRMYVPPKPTKTHHECSRSLANNSYPASRPNLSLRDLDVGIDQVLLY